MFLTRLQRKALRVAIQLEESQDVWVEPSDIAGQCGIPLRKAQGICESLANDGRIRWGNKGHTAFKLNETGRAYREIYVTMALTHAAAFALGGIFSQVLSLIGKALGV